MAYRQRSGCATVFLALFLVALVPASFTTPGMLWVGVLLIAVGLLALIGAVSRVRARHPRTAAVYVRRQLAPAAPGAPRRIIVHWPRRCEHWGAPAQLRTCRFCKSPIGAQPLAEIGPRIGPFNRSRSDLARRRTSANADHGRL
jgi:hypothetical protein